MPAVGYVLEEPERPGRFDVEKAKTLGVPEGPLFGRLQKGEAVTLDGGRTVTPDQVVGASRPGRKVVISGDTRPCDTLIEAAAGADLLIHESTFTSEDQERALKTMHTTALEAGEVAAKAGVRHLVLTHLSSRYDHDPGRIHAEARKAFDGRITVAEDGMTLEVPFADAAPGDAPG